MSKLTSRPLESNPKIFPTSSRVSDHSLVNKLNFKNICGKIFAIFNPYQSNLTYRGTHTGFIKPSAILDINLQTECGLT